ncbi:hypothetical protein WR25_13791 isoform C [Diploscapter pachys]|uniref:UBR-type domain-containing protein n=1 Tax=Diploscapter pachys TaxID=2018661 RepID=A0A2A2JHW0_9BILA|nr:hypothetical protein WR25_13791 isoform A [Diploscapter pachys]PAV61290.1 hypothetical protein WR25_13791 isoform C [Diploscapter pachys]
MSSNDAGNSDRMEKKEANGLTEKQSTIAMKLAERLVGQSDGSQDPTDEVITWSELVKEEEDEKEKDAALYGAQDFNSCTYTQGYLPRQTLFICLTCTPSPQQAGICLGCSENCHEGHELVELYTKRKFCCDCGNSKFTAKCKLFEVCFCIFSKWCIPYFQEKQPENQLNAYNQNYVGLFCHCNQPYPSPLIEEEEHQCVICEDWFHMTHIDPTFNVKDEELQKKMNGPGSMVCNSCIAKVPFLLPLESETDTSTVCFSKNKSFSVPRDKRFFLLAVKWRNRICKCAECIAIMEMAQCEYLIDSEDDLDTFVEKNLSKVKEEEEKMTEPAVARALVSEFGAEGAIHVLDGVNMLKRKMATFFEQYKDKVVTKDDVHAFFGQVHEEYEAKKARRDEDQNGSGL